MGLSLWGGTGEVDSPIQTHYFAIIKSSLKNNLPDIGGNNQYKNKDSQTESTKFIIPLKTRRGKIAFNPENDQIIPFLMNTSIFVDPIGPDLVK